MGSSSHEPVRRWVEKRKETRKRETNKQKNKKNTGSLYSPSKDTNSAGKRRKKRSREIVSYSDMLSAG